jgi:hypothetical protein
MPCGQVRKAYVGRLGSLANANYDPHKFNKEAIPVKFKATQTLTVVYSARDNPDVRKFFTEWLPALGPSLGRVAASKKEIYDTWYTNACERYESKGNGQDKLTFLTDDFVNRQWLPPLEKEMVADKNVWTLTFSVALYEKIYAQDNDPVKLREARWKKVMELQVEDRERFEIISGNDELIQDAVDFGYLFNPIGFSNANGQRLDTRGENGWTPYDPTGQSILLRLSVHPLYDHPELKRASASFKLENNHRVFPPSESFGSQFEALDVPDEMLVEAPAVPAPPVEVKPEGSWRAELAKRQKR